MIEWFQIMGWKGFIFFQAVSRQFSTAAGLFLSQVKPCGICGGQNGTWVGSLRVLRFPLPIFVLPTAPHSSSFINRGWYNRPISGRRTKCTQTHHELKGSGRGLVDVLARNVWRE
jgi:hypothetical protein